MYRREFVVILVAVIASVWDQCDCFEVPAATVRVFYPKGFEVSIPAVEGISLFAFHGKLNEDFDGLEAGSWARDVVSVKDGKFTFIDRITQLKIGDEIYFWLHVIYNGLGYNHIDGKHVVTGYINGTAGATIRPPPLVTVPTTPHTFTSTGDPLCEDSVTLVNNQPVCRRDLIFADNFDGPQVNSSIWKVQRRFAGDPDNEFVVYLESKDVVSVKDGALNVRPMLTENVFNDEILYGNWNLGLECTGEFDSRDCKHESFNDFNPPIVSGQLKSKFSFLYGVVEVRAQVPGGDWVFPQLFLEPEKYEYGAKNYNSGQMRVGFVSGGPYGNNIVKGGLLLNYQEPFRSHLQCTKRMDDNLSGDFHNYTLEWSPTGVRLFVDGTMYCSLAAGYHAATVNKESVPGAEKWARSSDMAPFDKPFTLTLGVGVGGHYDFPDNVSGFNKPWQNQRFRAEYAFYNGKTQWGYSWLEKKPTLKVDYVRVYAL